MNKVVHFEIPADDPERAKKFYADVFGWQVSDFGGTYMVTATPMDLQTQQPLEPGSINGDIFKRDEEVKHPTIVINVPSIEEHYTMIEANGGKPGKPKVEIPDMGYYGYFTDSEGNTIGLWEDLKK